MKKRVVLRRLKVGVITHIVIEQEKVTIVHRKRIYIVKKFENGKRSVNPIILFTTIFYNHMFRKILV